MNHDVDVEAVVHRWLAEGPTELPYAVLHAALAEVAEVPKQRRSAWRGWPRMALERGIGVARLAAAGVVALAVLVVIVGMPGLLLLPGGAPGGAPATSPMPTPDPSWCPTSSPATSPRAPSAPVTLACGGRFRTQAFRPTIDFTLEPGVWIVTLDSEAQFDLSVGPGEWLRFARLDDLVPEPCAADGVSPVEADAWRPPSGRAASDLHDRFAAIDGLQVGPLGEVDAAGDRAGRFEVRVPDGPGAACPGGLAVSDTGVPSGPLRIEPGSAGQVTVVEHGGLVVTFWVVGPDDGRSFSLLEGKGDAVVDTVSFP